MIKNVYLVKVIENINKKVEEKEFYCDTFSMACEKQDELKSNYKKQVQQFFDDNKSEFVYSNGVVAYTEYGMFSHIYLEGFYQLWNVSIIFIHKQVVVE